MPEVAIDLIKPSPYQPRLFFNTDDLKEEIERDGLLSALVVRKKDEYYELLDGERRLRTLKGLGWKRVPIDIRDVDDLTARRSVFKLNKIRENYNIEEEARYYKKLETEGMSPWEISQELGVSFSWVLANLNVFLFPQDILDEILTPRGELSVSHIKLLEKDIARNIDEVTEYLRGLLKGPRVSSRDLEKAISERETRVEARRLEAAKKGLPEEAVKLETPEDYDKAAEALKKKGKRMRREAMTPEELLQEEEEKQQKKRENEEKKRQEELRLLEAETIETTKTREEVERAKAKLRELVPEGKRTELEEVLATSDLSLGVLEKLPDAIKREPDRPIIEIARELHLEATPGLKKPRVGQPKPEPDLTDWVNEVTKTGYSLMELLDKMMAGNFRQIAPKIEILRINEMLFALEIKMRKYREGQNGEGGSNA